MMAIQLPGAAENAAWLIAAPTLWDMFPTTVLRFALPAGPSSPQPPSPAAAGEGGAGAADSSS